MIPSGTDFEKVFYLYILQNPKYFKSVKKGFFNNSEIDELSDISKSFYQRFKQIPSKDQLKTVASQDQFSGKLTHNIIDLIFDVNLSQYDDDWLQESAENWILWKNMDQSLIDTLEYVKTVKVSPDNVKDVIAKVKNLVVERNSIVFDDSMGLDFFDFKSHQLPKESLLSSNHQWIDNISGGYQLKSLIVYAGEQNIGKSIWLANDAVNFVKGGHDVAFISAEMGDVQVVHRAGANMLNIKMDEYKRKSRDENWMQKKLAQVKNDTMFPMGNLFVKEYPTSQATVPDIEQYLLSLEDTKGIKLKVIIIDYINILSNWRNPNSENTYMKIKQIAEDLRAMAVRNDWLIITATQINRGGYDSSQLNMSHIAESAGLSHTADMIYGIIQTNDMHLSNEYWLKVLKIRNGSGKGSKCRYEIMYDYMRLTETNDIMRDA